MAHFVLEFSDNLDHSRSSIQRLFEALHKSAELTGLFPIKDIRSRAHPCRHYRLADGHSEYGFAHLEVKLGTGHSLEDRKMAAELFFNVFCDHFNDQIEQRGMAVSFEMSESESMLKLNKNNIQDYL